MLEEVPHSLISRSKILRSNVLVHTIADAPDEPADRPRRQLNFRRLLLQKCQEEFEAALQSADVCLTLLHEAGKVSFDRAKVSPSFGQCAARANMHAMLIV